MSDLMSSTSLARTSGLTESAVRPAFATIDRWSALSGMGRRATYDQLGLGNLKAIKVGSRTLIDVAAGLAWLRSLPAAKIRAPRAAAAKHATEQHAA